MSKNCKKKCEGPCGTGDRDKINHFSGQIAKLEFSLPEESESFETAYNGWKFKGIVQDFDNYLRGKLKYEELDEKETETYRLIREQLWDIIKQYDASLFN